MRLNDSHFPENLVLENERALLRPLQTDDLGISFAFCRTGTGNLELFRRQRCRERWNDKLY